MECGSREVSMPHSKSTPDLLFCTSQLRYPAGAEVQVSFRQPVKNKKGHGHKVDEAEWQHVEFSDDAEKAGSATA
jgi:hypothetical protein